MADEEHPLPPPAPAPPADPVQDELADLVRVGRVGSGRRVNPAPDELLAEIRRYASSGYVPGLGTLVEVARTAERGERGPGLGVEAFSTIRRQLGSLVEDLDSIAVHVGPVLFVKTSAKNQPGTALRWLHEDERRALHAHPELLDHPGRLTAGLKKLVSAPPADPDAAAEAEPTPD